MAVESMEISSKYGVLFIQAPPFDPLFLAVIRWNSTAAPPRSVSQVETAGQVPKDKRGSVLVR